MAPPYRDSFPPDHDDLLRYSLSDNHHFFPTTPQASSSSSSSSLISFPDLFPVGLDHPHSDHSLPPLDQLKHKGGGIVGCNNDQVVGNVDVVETGLRFTINFQDLNQPLPSDQITKRSTLNDGGSLIIRTCSDCNTTKTPLWRSGPRGPKSLCNACGIRQRKARRAMAEAAAAAANGAIPCGGKPATVVLKTNKTMQHKLIKPAATLKRKCKDVVAGGGGGGGGGGRKKLCFEDITMSGRLSEISSSYQRIFPQDEREAAILLMTLSYGLLHG